jgi:hypothetical protein
MKVFGLDRKTYTLQLKNKIRGKCSDLHLRARKLLKQIFPVEMIFEEVTLPGSKTQSNDLLYVDFLLPSKSLAFEVQGQQHSEYVPFFHENKQGFGKAKVRDSYKREWCELNNILLIELGYNEPDEQWRLKIENR